VIRRPLPLRDGAGMTQYVAVIPPVNHGVRAVNFTIRRAISSASGAVSSKLMASSSTARR
jgi:hypothetical protein